MSALGTLPWKDYITLCAAIIGAVLGILNMWNTLNQRRIRLRVSPAHAIFFPDHRRGFCIEVVNLSAFPVTINEVGFEIAGRIFKGSPRLAVPNPKLLDSKPWPRRLESRESVSAYLDVQNKMVDRGEIITKAYVRTACGAIRHGNSPALRQLVEELKKIERDI
jgi:hypothetical protein